jgi:hypothetical protein
LLFQFREHHTAAFEILLTELRLLLRESDQRSRIAACSCASCSSDDPQTIVRSVVCVAGLATRAKARGSGFRKLSCTFCKIDSGTRNEM